MKNKSVILVAAAGIFWGTSGIFVNYLVPFGYTALQMSAIRGCVATLCFFIYTLIKDKSLLVVSRETLLLSALSGLSMYGCGACYYSAIQMTSISTAVMLMYTAPVIVMAYSVAFMGEKLTLPKLCSLIIMLIGCALISGVFGGFKFDLIGILVALLSGISYSSYNIITKIEMQKNINPIAATFYCFLFMSIISLIVTPPFEIIKLSAAEPAKTIPLILGTGICTSVIPYFLYTISLKHLPVGTAASLSIIEPMAATVFSVILFGEVLSVFSAIGIVFILSAVVIIGKTKV